VSGREEKLADHDQALETHVGKEKCKKEVHNHHNKFHKGQNSQRYYSTFKCFIYHKLGHISRNYSNARDQFIKGKNKRRHDHATADDK
jgi:hypothetical protein